MIDDDELQFYLLIIPESRSFPSIVKNNLSEDAWLDVVRYKLWKWKKTIHVNDYFKQQQIKQYSFVKTNNCMLQCVSIVLAQ